MRSPPISTLFPSPPLFRFVLERLRGDRELDEPLADPRVRPRRPPVDGQLPRQRHETGDLRRVVPDRKSTRLNSSHGYISYAVFCLKKKTLRDKDAISRHHP